ncbi:ribulose-phosphate 3-epimerase [Tautonia plasticadhaerens]|uniref:Ribulose-phosphate 3-epimerase n=1 Tax=Tautonia plasticadhaerens TaxID=2527974 RepID=A0A518HAK8_9BACT|nr:ribulose-phosphate 3-epimerase [Tautonia plasticadhaerens]QDV37895.1 Ribulose-phosphate 3-epimerase [Tautonia plasticadhaerens]
MPSERTERLRRWDGAPAPLITPSLLDCDFARVGEEIRALEAAGVEALHLDVMDGHFVPNLSYGPPVVADWRAVTDLPFDAHLMISDPARYLDAFVDAGADSILIHLEAVPEPADLLERIRGRGCRAGLVINPPTPWAAVEPHLDRVDSVLVMSVMPGFGGQQFQEAVLEKVRAIRRARPALRVAIDGGINASTAGRAVEAGATQLVVGSATYRPDGNYAASLGEVAEAARRGLEGGGAAAAGAGASPPE